MDTLNAAATATATVETKPIIAAPAPVAGDSKIHWAGSGPANKVELEEKFEAMRARNWITDRMVEQYQKHWHCTREAALERLLSKVGV